MSVTLSTTVYNWLRELKIPVSKTYIKQHLLSHPDYPSLLSITDTLNELDIVNTAVQIEKEQLPKIETPFLVHLNGNGGEFIVIKNNEQPDVQNFFKRWSGVVVAAEKPEKWFHSENEKSRSKDSEKSKALLLTLSILIGFILLLFAISFYWVDIILLLMAAAGVFVSLMIVSKDLGIENKIANQVCGKDADCDAVIHSKNLKLPFDIGWSDAGIIYFTFLLIALLIASFTNTVTNIYPLLLLFAAAAIPVTFVSIYYQWKVIKKWCRLCLVTVMLLWLQFAVMLPQTIDLLRYGFGKTNLTDSGWMAFLLSITASAWLWLKPVLKERKKLEAENFAAKRFQRNPDVFYVLLEKQRKLNVNPDGLGIIIGNPAATNTIIKVCNPYCGACAKAHLVIEKLLEKTETLKVQIIFNANDDEKDRRAKPVKHLMALYEKSNGQFIKQALNDWYMADKKDYELFAGKYTLNGELEKQGEKIKAMKEWCDEVKIEFTPSFFVNGYQLPKQYNIDELKYFLEK